LNSRDFQFSESDQTILPKSKWVAFNERLQSDDGLLATHWAKEKGLSQKQGFAAIHKFAEDLLNTIKTEQTFQFGNIGVFNLNKAGRLQFEPNQTINFDLNQYGLLPVSIGVKKTKPVLVPNPIERSMEDDEPITQTEPDRTSYQRQFYRYVIFAFLFGGIAAYFLTEPNSRFANSSFSPLTIRIKKSDKTTKKTVLPASTPKKVERVEEKKQAAVQNVSTGIYLVVSSFKTQEKAAQFQADLKSKGYQNVQIIDKGEDGPLFRVSLGEVSDFKAGYAEAARLKAEKNLDIWVYKK
jgi:cell division septation protein DedD/nucleoid DNA-binding protein